MGELKAAPEVNCIIEDVPDLPTDQVSIEGEVITLGVASNPKIAHVGLTSDDTGKIKFSSWVNRGQPTPGEATPSGNRQSRRKWSKGWLNHRNLSLFIVFTIRTRYERPANYAMAKS